jgi:hypothetical protein
MSFDEQLTICAEAVTARMRQREETRGRRTGIVFRGLLDFRMELRDHDCTKGAGLLKIARFRERNAVRHSRVGFSEADEPASAMGVPR